MRRFRWSISSLPVVDKAFWPVFPNRLGVAIFSQRWDVGGQETRLRFPLRSGISSFEKATDIQRVLAMWGGGEGGAGSAAK